MKSILLIEANRKGRNAPRSILGRAGYLLFGAPCARDAVAFASRSAPDLIVTGEPAEGPAGESLLLALRSHVALREIPILAVVAADAPLPFGSGGTPGEGNGEEPAWDALSLEGPPPDGQPDEIVRSPVNPFELIAKVRYLLDEDERRPPPRLALKRETEVQAGEIQAKGSLLNLSGSGALIETQAAGALEGPVRLRFRLPETERVVEPVGRVVWRTDKAGQSGRIAVEFVEMDPDSQRALESYLFLNG